MAAAAEEEGELVEREVQAAEADAPAARAS